MVTVKLRPWVPTGNITHDKTRWQIATDANFTNIIDDTESSTSLDTYYSSVSTAIGVKYFARATRFFNNGTDSGWLPSISFIASSKDNGVYLNTDIHIETPMVYVKKDEVTGNSKTITINTSKFRGVGDGHSATHWIIENGKGNIIYSKLNDTINKTSLTIDKKDLDLELSRYNNVVFKAIHKCGLDIESGIGSITINNAKFNFEVTNNMTNVEPYSSYTFTITKNSPKLNTNIVKMEIVPVDSIKKIYTYTVPDNELKITIPSSVLLPNSMVYVDLYVRSTGTTQLARKRLTLKTLHTRQVEVLDTNFKYQDKYTKLTDYNQILSNGVVSEEIYDGTILLPITTPKNNSLCRCTYDKENNALTEGDTITGISLLSPAFEYTYIKYTVDNKIIIDTLDNNSKPIFLLYTYDEYNKVATLLKSIVRADETLPIGKTSAIVFRDDKVYYIPVDSKKLKLWDMTTNTITTLKTIDLSNFINGVIIDTFGDEFIIVGGDSKSAYTYNISDNTLTSRSTIPPEFRGRPLKTQKLINGDTLIYRTTKLNTDTNNNLLVYKRSKHNFKTITTNLNTSIAPESSILFRDGSVVLYSKENNIFKMFKYE